MTGGELAEEARRRFFTSLKALFISFFFSSRRRHTSSTRDWSSDVCSSDLCLSRPLSRLRHDDVPQRRLSTGGRTSWNSSRQRSEERRVGKECISRCTTDRP